MASENFNHLNPGLNLVPNASTKVAVVGDIDYSSDTGSFNIFDSSGAHILVSNSGTQTLTNKTIPVGSNHITGTVNRAAQFNVSTGDLEASNVTDTELGYVSGVTSSIQTQLNSKQGTLIFADSLVNTGGTVTLVNDSASPGASKYYGTNGGGVLGYYAITPTGVTSVTASAPLASSGGNTPNISLTGIINFANGGTNASSATAAYNNLSPMTTTGDMEYESAPGVASRLPVGSNGKVLTVSAGIPSWQTFTALTNPMTSTGDIIYSSDGSGTPTRLPIGSSGQFLEVVSGLPAWNTVGGSSVVLFANSPTSNSTTNSINTNQYIGQSFTTGSVPAPVSNITLNLDQVGGSGATGSMFVAIYTNNAGNPGTLLGTSNAINANTLTSTNSAITFSFTSGPTLSAATQYFLVFQPSGVTFNSSTIEAKRDTTNPYAGGNLTLSSNAGSTWTPVAGSDLQFSVYGMNTTGILQFFASSQVSTSSSNIVGTSFATFSNSPAFTFTPTVTGVYEVYTSVPIFQGTTGVQSYAQIINTSGGASLLYNSVGSAFTSGSTYLDSVLIENVYILIAGTSYVFDIQGKNSSAGTLSIDAVGTPFYIFAKLSG